MTGPKKARNFPILLRNVVRTKWNVRCKLPRFQVIQLCTVMVPGGAGGGVGVRVACVAAALNLLYRAYGLYKWFRRVRRPAATQARLGGVCRSKNLDSGMFLRRKIWLWVAFLG